MAGSHNVKTTSWVAVGLMIVASILLGFALPLHSLPLAVAGAAVFLAGMVVGAIFHVMEDAY
jgi:hypothetical protein